MTDHLWASLASGPKPTPLHVQTPILQPLPFLHKLVRVCFSQSNDASKCSNCLYLCRITVNANVGRTARRFQPENLRKREAWRAAAALGEIAAVMAARPGARRAAREDRGGPRRSHPRRSQSAAQPSAAQPSAAQPSAAQPSAAQPSAAQPSAAQPSAAQPSAAQPSAAQPSAAQPSAAQPSAAQPSAEKPPTEQLAAGPGPCPGTTLGRPWRPAPRAA